MTDTTNTETLIAEWQKKAAAEASRQNSAYDYYGMGKTPESVDPLGASMAAELRRLAAVEAERNELRAKVEEYAGEQLRLKAKLCRHVKQKNKANSAVHAMRAECAALRSACRNAREIIAIDRQSFVDGQQLRDWRTVDPIANGLVAVEDGVWLDSDDAEALRDYDRALLLIDRAMKGPE